MTRIRGEQIAYIPTKVTEIDFGSVPVYDGTFTIVDTDVLTTSYITGNVAYIAPTNKDLDEITMDNLVLNFGPGAGQFTLYVRSSDGSYLHDKFKINYTVG